MNPRITDLLDDYVDTSVRLLPPEQVLRSNNSGKAPSPAPKPVQHRMKKPLVIAAALLLMLTGVAASVLTMSRGGSFGSSLSGGLSEAPSTAQWASQESAFSSSESVPDELILDDSNSVIVTSEATGLSMRVPTEYQDGLTVGQSVTLNVDANLAGTESIDYDGIFTFYDTSNQGLYDGLVFSIEAWDQSEFDSYLSDDFHALTFEFNSAVVGKQGDTYYSMLQFGNIPTSIFRLFDSTSLDSANAYYKRLQYVIPMVRSFIELNGLDTAETDLDSWDELFRQRMLEPMEQLIQELESNANSFAQSEQAPQDSIQPSEESLSLPAAQDTDGDGLLTAELNLSVETEYGTAVIQRFTLDISSGQFSWYADLSGLSGPFTEYSGNIAAARENDEFQAALVSVAGALQESILNSLLVYPDGSHLCLSTGELVSYENHVYRSYDTLGLTIEEPSSSDNPSCLELGGITYRFT